MLFLILKCILKMTILFHAYEQIAQKVNYNECRGIFVLLYGTFSLAIKDIPQHSLNASGWLILLPH